MIRFLLKLFVLFILAGVAFGDGGVVSGLVPVDTGGGFSWFGLALVLAIVGVIVGFVLWHKRNPSQADTALAAAKADALAVGHKALDLANGLRQTVAKQAEVIASPPVQAVINGPAPAAAAPPPPIVAAPVFAPAPTPVVPPAAVPAPTPAPAPAPVAASGQYPATKPDGSTQFYDEFGNPDDKGFYQSYQLKAVFAQRAQREAAVATGPLDLGALESGDKAYLVAMGEAMSFDARAMVRGPFYGIVSEQLGKDTFPEMGAARFNTVEFEKTVTPGVVDAVRGLAQGTAPWIPAAFVSWGGPAYIAAHQPAWALGWARVHGAPA